MHILVIKPHMFVSVRLCVTLADPQTLDEASDPIRHEIGIALGITARQSKFAFWAPCKPRTVVRSLIMTNICKTQLFWPIFHVMNCLAALMYTVSACCVKVTNTLSIHRELCANIHSCNGWDNKGGVGDVRGWVHPPAYPLHPHTTSLTPPLHPLPLPLPDPPTFFCLCRFP